MTNDERALKDALNTDGYSNEEKYFHDLNRELLQAQKAKREKKNAPITKPTQKDSQSKDMGQGKPA